VDTLGLVLAAVITGANVQDYDGARLVFNQIGHRFRRMQIVYADSIYAYTGLVGWVYAHWLRVLEIVKRPKKKFAIVAKRWIVERTFAWLSRCRRLSKDYERLPEVSQSWIYVSMIQHMLRRLRPS
jgi:putative transposase